MLGGSFCSKVGDHHRAVRCTAHPIGKITQQPIAQLVWSASANHQQVGALFEGAATHAACNVFVETQ